MANGARRHASSEPNGAYNRLVIPTVPRLADVLSAHPDVAAAYVFGSVAGGTAGPESDVDIAVLFTTPPPHTLDSARFALAGELEAALGAPVDLVVLNDAPVDLSIRVLRHGRLVVDRNPSARIGFEVRTRNEAFDLEPVLARYRSARVLRP
jgi:predicted nucleotidyltransferase